MILIKGRLLVFWSFISLMALLGCSQPQSTADIDKDIATIDENIRKKTRKIIINLVG